MKHNKGVVGCSRAASSALRFSIHFNPCLHGLLHNQFSGNRLGGKVNSLVGLFQKVQACLGMDTLLFSFRQISRQMKGGERATQELTV